MRILISIDDTDNLESIGTGEVLENLGAALRENALADCGFVTRHQLYIHESIPYTSHNSAMCCEAQVTDLPRVVTFCRSYMETACADGSDPGLCIVDLARLVNQDALKHFGLAAKKTILTKKLAYDTAALFNGTVFLSEHGGTGDGVIGALAGCGLRLTGADGKIKGKLMPKQQSAIVSAAVLCQTLSVSCCMDVEKNPVSQTDTVLFETPTKAVFWDHQPMLYLDKDYTGKADWRTFGIQELKGVVD